MYIDIIIITRNRFDDLNRCIQSIINCANNKIKIIIVDSSTEIYIRKKNENIVSIYSKSVDIIYIYKELSLGTLPEARNIGILNSSSDYLLFLDDDSFINNTTLPALNKIIQKYSDATVFGCRIIQGNEVYSNRKNFPKFSIFRWTTGSFNLLGSCIIDVDHLQGSCMCFKRDSLIQHGMFNTNLSCGYASFEDTEATIRVSQKTNKKIYLNLQGNIIHGVSPRLNGYPRDIFLNKKFAYSYGRNGVIASKIKFGIFLTVLFMPLTAAYNFMRFISGLIKDGKLIRFISYLYFFMGLYAGLRA